MRALTWIWLFGAFTATALLMVLAVIHLWDGQWLRSAGDVCCAVFTGMALRLQMRRAEKLAREDKR